MDEYTVDAFANRDDSIPLTSIPAENNGQEPSSLSDSTKEKLLANEHTDGAYDGSAGSRRRSILSIQDRLFAKYVSYSPPSWNAWTNSLQTAPAGHSQR